PDYLLSKVTTPTFIIQGTIDTLFPPTQAVENWQAMKADHPRLPLKMAWYCSGHGTCSPFDPGPAGFIDQRKIAWFDRYVKNRGTTNTGPPFEYVTNDGVWHQASGNQVTPTVVSTDGSDHTYDFRIEPIAYNVPAGDQVALEVASTSASYEAYRGGAAVTIKQLQVAVPALPAG